MRRPPHRSPGDAGSPNLTKRHKNRISRGFTARTAIRACCRPRGRDANSKNEDDLMARPDEPARATYVGLKCQPLYARVGRSNLDGFRDVRRTRSGLIRSGFDRVSETADFGTATYYTEPLPGTAATAAPGDPS